MNRRNFIIFLGCMAIVPFVPKVKAPVQKIRMHFFPCVTYRLKKIALYSWNFEKPNILDNESFSRCMEMARVEEEYIRSEIMNYINKSLVFDCFYMGY